MKKYLKILSIALMMISTTVGIERVSASTVSNTSYSGGKAYIYNAYTGTDVDFFYPVVQL